MPSSTTLFPDPPISSPRPGKQRLDQALAERELCDSREMAKRLILAGKVLVDGHVCDKASSKVTAESELRIKEMPKFVGRGGHKLEGALEHFSIQPDGFTCLDIGASTGGFTDCLLQHGATKVHALDVGTNQLVWKIRSDPRVEAQEKFNARYLCPDDLGGDRIDLVVIDVSFISLTLILPPAFEVLADDGRILCLIKPQFELARNEVGKGGIIREDGLREKAVEKIRSFVAESGHRWIDHVASTITGTDGNQEFLALLAKT